MGPGVLLYVERPGESDTWPPWVASVEVGDPEAGKSLENALRTALALSAMDAGGKGRAIGSRDVRGVPVTGLSGGRFAFAVAGGRFACAATPEAAAGGVVADPGGQGGDSTFERARAAHFPAAETFAFLDLDAIHEVADGRREALARGLAARRGGKPEDGRRDLDQVLALVHLFRFAFATQRGRARFLHRSPHHRPDRARDPLRGATTGFVWHRSWGDAPGPAYPDALRIPGSGYRPSHPDVWICRSPLSLEEPGAWRGRPSAH